MIHILRQHRTEIGIGILVALTISFFINLPLWTALITTDEWRWNDVVQESGDELFYLSRIQEVVDGHRHIGSPTIFERRDQIYPLGSLSENILSIPIRFFGWRMKTLSIVADALLPFLLSLVTWFAFARVIPDRRWRTIALSIIFLGGNVILWKRPISPQATSMLFVLWIWLLLSDNQDSRIRLILRSSLIGLMVYSYPFHWTYCIATEFSLLGITLFHERRMKKVLLSSCALIIPFLIIATPWILQSITSSHDHIYTETLRRLGLIDRRMPVGPVLQIKIFAVALLLWWTSRKKFGKDIHTQNALLLAGILVLWMPLITGHEAEFSNHYEKTVLFPLALVLTRSLMQLTKQSMLMTSAGIYISTLIIVIITLPPLQEGFRTFTVSRPVNTERRMLDSTLTILRTLPNESVLLTENSFASTLTTYTNHYAYMASTAYMYLAPDTEIILRGRIYNQLVPYDTIEPRGIFGTQYENSMLYARSLCRLQSLIGNTKDCTYSERKRAYDHFRQLPNLPASKVIDYLQEAHVQYVLLRKTPPLLRPFLREISTMPDGRILYAFRPLR